VFILVDLASRHTAKKSGCASAGPPAGGAVISGNSDLNFFVCRDDSITTFLFLRALRRISKRPFATG
jgi:hypothetical protein